MSYYDRNTKYLDTNRIIYRCFPWSDEPTDTYEWGWFYENGTHQCYTLFNSRAKINTYKSLKWHLYVLWYLNPQLDQEAFAGLVKYICNKRKLVGRSKISESEIYDAMLLINDENENITITKVAKALKCSTRTIYRNMSNRT